MNLFDRPLMAAILPGEVAVAETRGELSVADLFPEEWMLVQNAVAKRRREFAATRACARQALARLGLAAGPILSGPNREPLWPPEVVGSLTHCEGYCAAAVARTTAVECLGIDAESNQPLPLEIRDRIMSEAEWAALAKLPEDGVCWDRLVASAKESLFKAWFPRTRQWLDFLEASVEIKPDDESFIATLHVPGPMRHGGELKQWPGRYRVRDGLIVTAVLIESGAAN